MKKLILYLAVGKKNFVLNRKITSFKTRDETMKNVLVCLKKKKINKKFII